MDWQIIPSDEDATGCQEYEVAGTSFDCIVEKETESNQSQETKGEKLHDLFHFG